MARRFERTFSWGRSKALSTADQLEQVPIRCKVFDLAHVAALDDDSCDSHSRDTLSSTCSTTYSEDGCSWGDIAPDACQHDSNEDFAGLEENDGLGPLVHEQVKEAVLVPLSQHAIKTIWSPIEQTIMEGMLFKKGRAQMHALQPRTWKYRYFKLQSNGELAYYKNHHKKGSVLLTGKDVRLSAGTSFRTCIEPKTGNSNSTEWRFSVRTDQQEIVLAARTKNEMRKWLTFIRALCEARSNTVELVIKLEVEVDPMSMVDYLSDTEKAGKNKVQQLAGRGRAKSALPRPRPKNVAINSHHYDTFSPKENGGISDGHMFESDMGDALGSPRARAKTDVRQDLVLKTKDWNERDGVLRIIKINNVPSNVYQPKFTMKVQVKI